MLRTNFPIGDSSAVIFAFNRRNGSRGSGIPWPINGSSAKWTRKPLRSRPLSPKRTPRRKSYWPP